MATGYLASLQLQHPEAAEVISSFEDFFNRKLWYQLCCSVEAQISQPWLAEGDTLVMFYELFVKEFEQKINPIRVMKFAVAASRKYADHDAAIQFLNDTMERLKPAKQEKETAGAEANLLGNVEIARHKLSMNKVEESKEMMNAAEKALDAVDGTEDGTFSAFYQLCAEYHKKREAPTDYYRSSLQYLTYTPMDTLSTEEQREIARDLCLAALVAETIYTFGELLVHPVLQSLQSTEYEWMVIMLKALNVGNIAAYRSLCETESVRINNYPVMISNEGLLKQKLAIAALIELIFRRKADERLITFADIAVGTNLTLDEVELLLIKALSLKLIRGTIDEVDQVVHITWAIPHALDMDQIAVMKDNLVSWKVKTEETMKFVEDQSPELFT